MRKNKKAPELTEDIEVVGPGQMLADAREKIGLSQQDVADKLNFRLTLVKDIEADSFDKSLPATYNRGYLRNYAKLVEISVDEVLASYEMLGIAQVQGAEMQSFSKITEKQAQNNRLMWVTYLILAILIGSTLLWWIQGMNSKSESENQNPAQVSNAVTQTESQPAAAMATTQDSQTEVDSEDATVLQGQSSALANELNQEDVQALSAELSSAADTSVDDTLASQSEPTDTQAQQLSDSVVTTVAQNSNAATVIEMPVDTANKTTVIFTFAGDCWVNIYDATGERIAWGVKKTGYVMTIAGVAPFKITLGKPELVQINYDGQDIDMSQFNVGNIAKFSLPLES